MRNGLGALTHWGRVTHICVRNLTIIGSDNGLSPGRRQAITWTNVGILLMGPLGTNFSEMLIEIHTFSFKKIHLKMLSGKWRPFCLGLNVLISVALLSYGLHWVKMRRLIISTGCMHGCFQNWHMLCFDSIVSLASFESMLWSRPLFMCGCTGFQPMRLREACMCSAHWGQEKMVAVS